jgi:hypothetical protein
VDPGGKSVLSIKKTPAGEFFEVLVAVMDLLTVTLFLSGRAASEPVLPFFFFP